MSDLDTIKAAFDQVGIKYLVGMDKSTSLLYMVSDKLKSDFDGYSAEDIYESLGEMRGFIEFDSEGKLASY